MKEEEEEVEEEKEEVVEEDNHLVTGSALPERFRVGELPTAYYVPNYLTVREEEYLKRKIYDAPRTKWSILKHRRLQNWGGYPHVKGMVATDLPAWLSSVGNKLARAGLLPSQPNHVLIK